MDHKLIKSAGHFEENNFTLGCHQFLLDYCPKLIKTYNLGHNADNKRQMRNKNECKSAARLFIFKVAETLC